MEDLKQIFKELATFLGDKLDKLNKELGASNNDLGNKLEILNSNLLKKEITVVEVKGERGDPGKDSNVPGPQGDPGPKGDQGPEGKPGKDGKNGKDGRDSSIPGPKGDQGPEGKPGKDGKNGKDGSPDTGAQIIAKINSNKTDKIKASKVEGFEEIESMAKTAEANSRLGLRAGGDTVYLADLSAQTNGVTKVFTLPVNPSKIIMVTGSDFPTVMFLNNGFTRVGGTVTLTTTNAPSQGSQLGCLYVV